MDLTGPFIESKGYIYILTAIDHFTRWLETRPLRNKEAKEEHLSREFPRIPPLIFLEVGHLITCVDERSIENIIMIPHKDNQLESLSLLLVFTTGKISIRMVYI